ncbi:MAG TPA: ABC transporter permease [Candidatus Limnocylindria bacterium]
MSGEVAPFGGMVVQQTRGEFLKLWRSPIFSIFSLALPVMFYVFFGLQNAQRVEQGVNIGAYVLASLSAYAVANVMLFSFGIGVALDRGRKYDVLMRATALRPIATMIAKLLTGVAFALLALVVLFAVAALVGGQRMETSQWLTLTWRLLIGAIPFLALGFAIGYSVSPNAAPAVVNLIALPMYFGSGLFIPLDQLPSFIRSIAPYLPAYHYGQIVWDAVGKPPDNPLWQSAAWLIGYTLLFAAIAVRAYRADESKKFS